MRERRSQITTGMKIGETRTIELKGPMKRPCKDCPFVSENMQRSLGTGRLDEIKKHVEQGGFFACHKTIDYEAATEDEYGNALHVDIEELLNRRECAGAVRHKRNARVYPAPTRATNEGEDNN